MNIWKQLKHQWYLSIYNYSIVYAYGIEDTYKTGCRQECIIYRPNTLLSCLHNLFVAIRNDRLTKIMEYHEVPNENKTEFSRKRLRFGVFIYEPIESNEWTHYHGAKAAQALNFCIHIISDWPEKWLVSPNPNKAETLVVYKRRTSPLHASISY